MSLRQKFEISNRYNLISMALMAVGIVSIALMYFAYGASADPHVQARFWGSLLHNSVYFLLVVNAAMFFMCITTLAWGGWQMSFRRVSEAVSASVPVIALICGVILMALVHGGNHEIYHWTDAEHVKHDAILLGKSGFLSKGFFTIWTIITLVLWSALGWKMRQLSRSIEDKVMTLDESKSYIWTNTVWSAVYLAFFGLTVMSSIPWLWLMSIDAHWYSTMFSWYTFASSFVPGVALITLFVVYLKNRGYLELTSKEHLHDLGKFMFAFSIFWTYLWYSQFMLIWYANIPEETIYFVPRMRGVYKGLFFLNLIINFVAPLLLLMKKDAKRNYTTVTVLAILIIVGHWLDFFLMVFPSISGDHIPVMLYDFGVALGFAGLIMFLTARALARSPLILMNHPFTKESIIHHT